MSCDSHQHSGNDQLLDHRPDNKTCIAGNALAVEGLKIKALAINLPESVESGSVTVLKQNLQVDNSWYLVKQSGAIYKLNQLSAEASVTVYLDLHDKVFDETSNEQGLVGLAFHPDFENFPQVFIYYIAASATSLSGAEVRLSRFTEVAGVLDPNSEEILIQYDKDAAYHHSGTLEVAADGYLYISVGDDTLNGNWNKSGNAQNPFSLKGKLLRIDVSGASGYSIPPDNPFASGENGAPEVFALGLRNPWKFSFDSLTQDIWVGDVGRVGSEEINKIEINKNYGWPLMEGNRCYSGNDCSGDTYTRPYVAFDRSDKNCIIGGYVYRGNAIEEMQGQYLSGDCVYGSVWLSDVYGEKINNRVNSRVVLASQENITSFAEDESKEIYFSAVSGNIFKIVPLDNSLEDQTITIKEKLSETGCVNMRKPSESADTTIAYRIRFPFWSDKIEKYRFIALPNQETIKDFAKIDGDYYQPYTYDLPLGTVLIKNFEVDGKFIETRLFARHSQEEWRGYSYEWNDEQTEAYLLNDSKTKTLSNGQVYYFPSQNDCLTCHTHASQHVLGFNPYQLNLTLRDGQKEQQQLSYLKRLGIAATPEDISPEKFADIHEQKNALWVKSYLHSNCAFCHQEGASLDLGMDFRFTQNLNDLTNLVPMVDEFTIENAKIIAPGRPEKSILLNRIQRKDDERMPFIGNFLVDEQAVEKITKYINSL